MDTKMSTSTGTPTLGPLPLFSFKIRGIGGLGVRLTQTILLSCLGFMMGIVLSEI